MDKFDLKKYLAEGKLLVENEGDFKSIYFTDGGDTSTSDNYVIFRSDGTNFYREIKRYNDPHPKYFEYKSAQKWEEAIRKFKSNPILRAIGVRPKFGKNSGVKSPPIELKLDRDDLAEGKLLNEVSKVNKGIWDGMSDDEKESTLLTVFEDPDDVEKYIDSKWEDLPNVATSNMIN